MTAIADIRSRQESPLKASLGMYAQVEVCTLLDKLYVLKSHSTPRDSKPSSFARLEQTMLYHAELRNAGVSIPEPYVGLDASEHKIKILQACAGFEDAFREMVTSSYSRKEVVVRAVTRTVAQVFDVMNGPRPIGVDIGLVNYFVPHSGGQDKAVLVDIYPPRLGFHLAEGRRKILPLSDRLVDYPEHQRLSLDRQEAMRKFMYTPDGCASDLLAWIVTAPYAACAELPRWETIKDSTIVRGLTDVFLQAMVQAGHGASGTKAVAWVFGPAQTDYLNHRITRGHERFVAVRTVPWAR